MAIRLLESKTPSSQELGVLLFIPTKTDRYLVNRLLKPKPLLHQLERPPGIFIRTFAPDVDDGVAYIVGVAVGDAHDPVDARLLDRLHVVDHLSLGQYQRDRAESNRFFDLIHADGDFVVDEFGGRFFRFAEVEMGIGVCGDLPTGFDQIF